MMRCDECSRTIQHLNAVLKDNEVTIMYRCEHCGHREQAIVTVTLGLGDDLDE